MTENESGQSEYKRIINRHKARMLSELEGGNCPKIYINCVKRNLDWLRSDLDDMDNEKCETE